MELQTYKPLTPITALDGVSVLHNDFHVKAMELIVRCLFRCGQSKDDTTLELLIAEFVKDIRSDFPSFTIQEVEIALDSGVKNKDIAMINNRTLYSMIKDYSTSETRRKAKLVKVESEKVYEPVMTKEESYKAWKYTILRNFHHFKETGDFQVYSPRLLFERLEKFGMLNLSPEDKKEIYDFAVENVIEHKRSQRLERKYREKATQFINRHEAKISTKEDIEEFKEEARIVAIKQYWIQIETFDLP